MRLFHGTTQPTSVFGTKRTSMLTLGISVQRARADVTDPLAHAR